MADKTIGYIRVSTFNFGMWLIYWGYQCLLFSGQKETEVGIMTNLEGFEQSCIKRCFTQSSGDECNPPLTAQSLDLSFALLEGLKTVTRV